MHKRWLNLLIVFVLGFVVPALILVVQPRRTDNDAVQTDTTEQTPTQSTTEESDTQDNKQILISILQEDGTVTYMDLENYVKCVVLAEMPASFEVEALKAQAVVARTYTLRRLEGNAKHQKASVCTEPSCCQGFRTEEMYLDHGGTVADVERVEGAVSATAGLVLVYGSELIEATYFSCSGGITEDAAAVWGEEIPYLKSTVSPGEEHAANYVDTIYLTADTFADLLDAELSGRPETWIGKITYTAGMGVDTMQIGSNVYQGTQLRSLLGLRSTAFTITMIGNTVVITTRGYGHRVGMSQYGADAMAVNGSTFRQILAHYYQGTELIEYS